MQKERKSRSKGKGTSATKAKYHPRKTATQKRKGWSKVTWGHKQYLQRVQKGAPGAGQFKQFTDVRPEGISFEEYPKRKEPMPVGRPAKLRVKLDSPFYKRLNEILSGDYIIGDPANNDERGLSEDETRFFVGYDVDVIFDVREVGNEYIRAVGQRGENVIMDVQESARGNVIGNIAVPGAAMVGLKEAMVKAQLKANKEAHTKGFGFRSTHVSRGKDIPEFTGWESAKYAEILNGELTGDVVKIVQAYQISDMIAQIKSEFPEKRGEYLKETWGPITKMGFVAQVMAEYIEDGMQLRLAQAGLADSDLAHSIKVEPAIRYLDNLKIEARIGVYITMLSYGVYLDLGRGQTRNSGDVVGRDEEGTKVTQFWQAIYAWAEQNISVTPGGIYGFNLGEKESKKVSAYQAYEHRGGVEIQEQLPPVTGWQASQGWTDEELGDEGSSRWIGALRKGEERVRRNVAQPIGRSKLHQGRQRMEPEDSSRGMALRMKIRRGKSKKKGPATFNEIVWAIYMTINKRGYRGNHFLTGTINEMKQRGLLEYYTANFIRDIMRESVKKSTRSAYGRVLRNLGKSQVDTRPIPSPRTRSVSATYEADEMGGEGDIKIGGGATVETKVRRGGYY